MYTKKKLTCSTCNNVLTVAVSTIGFCETCSYFYPGPLKPQDSFGEINKFFLDLLPAVVWNDIL